MTTLPRASIVPPVSVPKLDVEAVVLVSVSVPAV